MSPALDRRAGGRRSAATHIGFIFQDFNLIPVLTAYENIEYPLIMVQNWPPEKRRDAGHGACSTPWAWPTRPHKRPDQLSGGQKQRVAVARALVANAKLVLADEPTANLDHDTAYRIIELMKKMRDELGTTFVFSTHDPKIMREAEVTFTLEDGRLVDECGSQPCLSSSSSRRATCSRYRRRTLLTLAADRHRRRRGAAVHRRRRLVQAA